MFRAFALRLEGLMLFLDCEKRAGSPAAQGFLAIMLFVILLQHGYGGRKSADCKKNAPRANCSTDRFGRHIVFFT